MYMRPPTGVMAPSQRWLVSVMAYNDPEKSAVPPTNSCPGEEVRG